MPLVRLTALFCGLLFSSCHQIPREPSFFAGIPNFGRINADLVRGAQPDATGLANLHQLGVRTIINLRMPGDTWPAEAAVAESLGLGYVSMPLPGLRAPSAAQVALILTRIANSPPPVFIHCEHGADRTGTIIACYRMSHDNWRRAPALAEAETHGLSIFQFGMRHFIENYSPSTSGPSRPSMRVRDRALSLRRNPCKTLPLAPSPR